MNADSYDRTMVLHADCRGAVLVKFPTPTGHRTEPATLTGWRLQTSARGGRYARVQFTDGAERTVRQADVILPGDDAA